MDFDRLRLLKRLDKLEEEVSLLHARIALLATPPPDPELDIEAAVKYPIEVRHTTGSVSAPKTPCLATADPTSSVPVKRRPGRPRKT